MDLRRHIRIMWKQRLAMAVGLLVGAALAVLVSYEVQPGKSPLITPRGVEEWMSVSRLLVTQEGFPEGRVTLPGGGPSQEPETGALLFADPARFQGLASLYAVLASSDQVRTRLKPPPKREQITALVVDPDGPGSLASLPVLELSTLADSAATARKLNVDTVAALRGVLAEQQDDNKIDVDSRVRLDSLDLPSAPFLVAGRSRTTSLVVFMIALLAAFGFAQLREGSAGRKSRAEGKAAPPAPVERAEATADPPAPEVVERDDEVEPLRKWTMPEYREPKDEVAAGSKRRRR